MRSYSGPIEHRPERDGTFINSTHVPFYLAMEYGSDSWASLLEEACGDLLVPGDLGVVDVSATFTHEMFVGDVVAEVSLVRLGTSSLAFRVELYQEQIACADITTVLVRLESDRKSATPLAPEQRAALAVILEN